MQMRSKQISFSDAHRNVQENSVKTATISDETRERQKQQGICARFVCFRPEPSTNQTERNRFACVKGESYGEVVMLEECESVAFGRDELTVC
jgi:hypothetical protein